MKEGKKVKPCNDPTLTRSCMVTKSYMVFHILKHNFDYAATNSMHETRSLHVSE